MAGNPTSLDDDRDYRKALHLHLTSWQAKQPSLPKDTWTQEHRNREENTASRHKTPKDHSLLINTSNRLLYLLMIINSKLWGLQGEGDRETKKGWTHSCGSDRPGSSVVWVKPLRLMVHLIWFICAQCESYPWHQSMSLWPSCSKHNPSYVVSLWSTPASWRFFGPKSTVMDSTHPPHCLHLCTPCMKDTACWSIAVATHMQKSSLLHTQNENGNSMECRNTTNTLWRHTS